MPTYEDFNRQYVEWYDTRNSIRRFSRRQTAQGTADLLDIMDMIEIMMEQHQMTFVKDDSYEWRIYFPYMFFKPKVGDEIRNMTTNEVYSILYVEELAPQFRRAQYGPYVRNPKEDTFTGIVILSGTTAPNVTDRLQFLNREDRLINFFEWGNRRHSKVPSEDGEGDLGQGERGRFMPTITWSVKRVEPGAINGKPFSSQKMVKPTLRGTFPDPTHSYLTEDNRTNESLKQSNIYPTGDPLYSGSYKALTEAQMDPRWSTHGIEVYGQWFDNLVQYDCWSNSNQEANALIAWFEDFMELYTPILRQNGVNQMLYWERLQDQTIERWRNDIDNRTIRWFFRTEKLRVRRQRNFSRFIFKLSLGTPSEELKVYTEPTGIGTWTGQFGRTASQLRYDTFTGATGHFTGDGSYMWGQLTIEET